MRFNCLRIGAQEAVQKCTISAQAQLEECPVRWASKGLWPFNSKLKSRQSLQVAQAITKDWPVHLQHIHRSGFDKWKIEKEKDTLRFADSCRRRQSLGDKATGGTTADHPPPAFTARGSEGHIATIVPSCTDWPTDESFVATVGDGLLNGQACHWEGRSMNNGRSIAQLCLHVLFKLDDNRQELPNWLIENERRRIGTKT